MSEEALDAFSGLELPRPGAATKEEEKVSLLFWLVWPLKMFDPRKKNSVFGWCEMRACGGVH